MGSAASVVLGRAVDEEMTREISPDLLVWAVGARQNIPDIPGLDEQYTLTSLEYLGGTREVRGPRVLVIGAGRVGIEIVEKLAKDGYEVTATKRTDPIGSHMEMITRKLALMRLEKHSNVTLMPHTTVKGFKSDRVEMERDGEALTMEPFQTVILATGMVPGPGPGDGVTALVPNVEIIGDARDVQDIYSATHAGYRLALAY
jgi:pyruvate/2-oxoglutarate dehydrogenase complex dihydrolipoamide dehydrogenase (E3) component